MVRPVSSLPPVVRLVVPTFPLSMIEKARAIFKCYAASVRILRRDSNPDSRSNQSANESLHETTLGPSSGCFVLRTRIFL